MKGFIVYPTYRIVEDKAYVYLFGRLENGESFLTINNFRPYFYIRTKDKNKLKKIETELKYDVEDTKFKTFFDDDASKIILNIPRQVSELRDLMNKEDIMTYEADVRFVYRFMIDRGIKGSMEIKGEYKKGNFVNRIYENPELKASDFKPKLKVMAIDLESSPDLKNLYSISLVSKDFSKVLIVSNKKLKNAESLKNEKAVLERFKELIHEHDPDIITGWNLINFDLDYLKKKFDKHNIPFVLGRADWVNKLRISTSFFMPPTADIAGRMALDGISLLKSSFIRLTDYKLQTASEEILGESKLIEGEINKGEEIKRQFKEEPQKLVDYNLKDSELVIKILDKKGLIDLSIQRSLLTGMQLDKVKSPIRSFDNLYIRETMLKGLVCPTGKYSDRTTRIRGAYVKDSIPGIYDYIIVLDFKSLYPSMMRTFNIDPWSYIPKEMKYKGKFIEAPNGARFKKQQGILPDMLERLWKQRDLAKKNKNDAESYAIKITMNSFFGLLANPTCRFYSLDIANAITYYGQFVLKTTEKLSDEMGHKVIYGDTDSIFVDTKAKNVKEAEVIGNKIVKEVNKYWDDYTKKLDIENHMELQFEKIYTRFMMPKIRGTDKGAKKRYAGLLLKDGKEKIDFTGLEFVRRDWTGLAKKFQLELLEKIFHKQEVVDYIKKFVSDVRKGKHDSLLIYKKAIRKNLDEYVKTTPPHVKAARKMKKLNTAIIQYVMTIDGPEPLQQVKHKLDYDHYIEKQVKPIADSVLVFYNKKFDDLLTDSKQTSLFGFS